MIFRKNEECFENGEGDTRRFPNPLALMGDEVLSCDGVEGESK